MSRFLSLFVAVLLAGTSLSRTAAASEPPATSTQDPVTALVLEGIHQNFAGDWDGAERTFGKIPEVDPDHPAGSFFLVTTAFWRRGLEIDELKDHPRLGDERLVSLLETTIERSKARIESDPRDAEAYLYWGQALTYLGRIDADNGRYIAGGTKGEQGRERLEKALEIDPTLGDAKFPTGAYYFFASLIPRALKWLSFLPFVPSGDREDGLRLLNECLEECVINELGARLVLFAAYGFHIEGAEEKGLAIARSLRERFPDNGLLHVEQTFVLLKAGRYDEAMAAGAEIAAKADAGERTYDPAVGRFGRVSQARAQLLSGDVAGADAALTELEAGEPITPEWVLAWANLTRAQIHDLRGERDAAEDLYERIVDSEPGARGGRAQRMAEQYLDDPFVSP